jgi:hypothetical protein
LTTEHFCFLANRSDDLRTHEHWVRQKISNSYSGWNCQNYQKTNGQKTNSAAPELVLAGSNAAGEGFDA